MAVQRYSFRSVNAVWQLGGGWGGREQTEKQCGRAVAGQLLPSSPQPALAVVAPAGATPLDMRLQLFIWSVFPAAGAAAGSNMALHSAGWRAHPRERRGRSPVLGWCCWQASHAAHSSVCLHKPTVLYISDTHSAFMLPAFFIFQSLVGFFWVFFTQTSKCHVFIVHVRTWRQPRACVNQVLLTPAAQ